MASVSGVAAGLVDGLGVSGIGAGVFLNGLGVPGLSEVLLPLGGAAVSKGQVSLVSLMVVAMVAQLAGLSVAYAIARYGGVAMVERYGKYVLITHHDLEAADRAFEKYGQWLVLFGAFIPGVQSFIGYAAGLAAMNYARFVVSALVGKLVWVGGLVYLGSILGNHLDLIDHSVKQIGVVVLAGMVCLAIWYVRRHAKNRPDKGAKRED